VQINTILAEPSINNEGRCGNGTVTFSVSNSPGTVNWFSSVGGSVIATGLTFTTPPISQSSTYYAQTVGLCPSAVVPVTANVYTVFPDPIISNVTRCGIGSITFIANGSDILWYDLLNNQIGSGATFTIQNLNNDTSVYAVAGQQCPSNQVLATARILPLSPEPVVTNAQRCGQGNVSLTSNSDSTYWYDQIGGSLLAVGTQFSFSATQSGTYYATNGTQCPSNPVSAQVSIIALPIAPTINDQQKCANSTFVFTSGIDSTNWYNISGSQVGTGSSFSTILTDTTMLVYQIIVNGCTSMFDTVNAITIPVPPLPVINDFSICIGNDAVFNVPTTDTLKWFDNAGGTLLFTGNPYVIASLQTNTTVYVMAQNVCSSNLIPVTVYALSNPIVNLGNDTIIAVGQSVELQAGSGFMSYQWNSGDTTASLQVSTSGVYSVLVTTAAGCTGTDTIEVLVATNVPSYSMNEVMLVFPNPAIDRVNVFLRKQLTDGIIQLFDLSGKIIQSHEVNEMQKSYNFYTSNLARGIYFIRLSGKSGTGGSNIKIILQ
jgi:hypothetical protein